MEMSEGFLAPRAGYERLVTYQKSLIIFQGTFHVAGRWLRAGTRTRDQMEQAARSGKQNIVEASLLHATSLQSEIHLTNVSRSSLGELLEDFKDFLRLRGLPIWDKNDPRAIAVRGLAKAGEQPSYEVYRSRIESDDPEVVGNTMICLIMQTCYLLDQQIRRLEEDFLREGGIRERMTRARLEARAPQAPSCPECGEPMRKRTARTGPRAGEEFWGCSGYPECRGTRRVEEG